MTRSSPHRACDASTLRLRLCLRRLLRDRPTRFPRGSTAHGLCPRRRRRRARVGLSFGFRGGLHIALGGNLVRGRSLGLLRRLVFLRRRRIPITFHQVALVVLVRLEIGLVPAASLQAEDGRGYQLLQLVLATFRTFAKRRVGDFLQHFDLRAAGRTLLFVERHSASIIRTWRDENASW